MSAPWYRLHTPAAVPSPALLLYPERIDENIRRMIALAGDPARLRPHLKTHKLAEVLQLQTARGITKFKCATIAEAELAAECGVPDLLLAYQPVGPNVGRLLRLVARFPATQFSALADDADALRALASACAGAGVQLPVLLDIDCGQHRTGVAPGPGAIALYQLLATLPGLTPGGLHAYDGHIQGEDPAARTRDGEAAFALVRALRQELRAAHLPVPRVVAGGTPTFPIHARRRDVECSPGTCVLWDQGYATRLPDLAFVPAAVVLTRVVSRPGRGRLCLDLGHKAIAAEHPPPRVHFLDLPDATPVAHSEEHLVIETPQAHAFKVGDCLYGVPWHICPTVALYAEVTAVVAGEAVARWPVRARARALSI